jgi:hypothetical protein
MIKKDHLFQAIDLDNYKVLKSYKDANTGFIEVLKHSSGKEYLIAKKLPADLQVPDLDKLLFRIKSLESPLICQLKHVESKHGLTENTVLFFEFPKKTLHSEIKRATAEGKCSNLSSEESIRKLLKSMVESCSLLEHKFEHHPSITQQNIYLREDSFVIINPYIYDVYIREALGTYNRDRLVDCFYDEICEGLLKRNQYAAHRKDLWFLADAIQIHGDRIQTNLFQTGIVILASGLQMKDQEIKEEIRAGGYDALEQRFQKLFSNELTNIVRDMIFGKFTSFAQLLVRLQGRSSEEPSHSFWERIEEDSDILPLPTDFESEK